MTARKEFVDWFQRLPPEEQREVWYECEAMSSEDFKAVLKLGSDARKALIEIESLCKKARN